MANNRYIPYFRVSTQEQGRSGLGIEGQRAAVESYLRTNGGVLVNGEFVEVESGKNSDRPQLKAALAACRIYRAQLLVSKLDRLSRNLHFVSTLMESGVELRLLRSTARDSAYSALAE